jgi:hypothetical protein
MIKQNSNTLHPNATLNNYSTFTEHTILTLPAHSCPDDCILGAHNTSIATCSLIIDIAITRKAEKPEAVCSFAKHN